MNFEGALEHFRLAVLTAIRYRTPSFPDGRVRWANAPAGMGGKDGEVVLDVTSAGSSGQAGQSTRRKKAATKEVIEERFQVYTATIDVQTRYPSAVKGLDMAGIIRDALEREDLQLALEPVKITWACGPLRNVSVPMAGRKDSVWSFDVPIRFGVEFSDLTAETTTTIGAVEITVDTGDDQTTQDVRVDFP